MGPKREAQTCGPCRNLVGAASPASTRGRCTRAMPAVASPTPAAGHPPSAPAQWPGFSGATGPVAPTRPLPAHAGPPPRSGLGSLVQRGPLHLPGLCPRMPVRPRAVAWVLWCNGARCTYPASARACRPPPCSGLGSLVQRGPLHLPGLCPRMPVRPRAVASVLWCNGARCTYPASARACRTAPPVAGLVTRFSGGHGRASARRSASGTGNTAEGSRGSLP